MSAEPARLLIPLSEDKTALLQRLVDGLDSNALTWLSGYAAGLAAPGARTGVEFARPAADAITQQRATIVFGSQTGNAKRLAEALSAEIEKSGLGVRLLRADQYPPRELKSERLLYVVISTQGEGDPPDDSRGFVEFLTSKRAPKLGELKFAVLGLGDSSYAKFCAIGAGIDTRLQELGATRLFARGDADVDIETIAKPWLASAAASARDVLKAPSATITPLRPLDGLNSIKATPASARWSRDLPFAADVLVNQRISARDASKDIRHLEISLRDSGLVYEPGDALGVWPTNAPSLVDAVIAAGAFDADASITVGEETFSLREWLLRKRELTQLARPFVVAHAARAENAELQAIIDAPTREPMTQLLGEYQLIDLLRRFPARWDVRELVATLRPLAPRLYSIASSMKAVEEEAHLTVAVVDYDAFGDRHGGAASQFLASRDIDGEANINRAPVYIESNDRFRLPQDASRDVIMIGPGTGVAPFRGFLQERAVIGASGRNWLLFGNPHLRHDFLYQVEWQQALKNGTLHRLDVAFSRDQLDKVYVQHRIAQRGRELYDWIERGAHLYVCGDATRMAKDVHEALRSVLITHGGRSREDAEDALSKLIQQRRYSRDVY